MEIGESSAAGAARETLEEANAAVKILGPYAHWDIPVIGQVRREYHLDRHNVQMELHGNPQCAYKATAVMQCLTLLSGDVSAATCTDFGHAEGLVV
jgi:ADP-ribose pyrophosphatase YjhB (NUDIX family)